MSTDFSDPKKKLQSELEDLHDDIDQRIKELRNVNEQLADLQKQKELLEAELEELYDQEKRLEQKIKRPE